MVSPRASLDPHATFPAASAGHRRRRIVKAEGSAGLGWGLSVVVADLPRARWNARALTFHQGSEGQLAAAVRAPGERSLRGETVRPQVITTN